MKWTTKPPTKPGWYWAEPPGEEKRAIRVLPPDDTYKDDMRIKSFGDTFPSWISFINPKTKWAGPIEEPTDD